MIGGVAHVPQRTARDAHVTCVVIGRTGEKVRLRGALAPLELATGDSVLVDDDWQTMGAQVIGVPAADVVELDTGGVTEGMRLVVRRSVIGNRRTT